MNIYEFASGLNGRAYDSEIITTFEEQRAKELGNSVIIGGSNYGQGSSREHAAICPMYLGVKAVIAKSIERIHRANLINFGIVPFTFVEPGDYDRIAPGDTLQINSIREAIKGEGIAEVKSSNGVFKVKTALSSREKHLVLSGGLLASL